MRHETKETHHGTKHTPRGTRGGTWKFLTSRVGKLLNVGLVGSFLIFFSDKAYDAYKEKTKQNESHVAAKQKTADSLAGESTKQQAENRRKRDSLAADQQEISLDLRPELLKIEQALDRAGKIIAKVDAPAANLAPIAVEIDSAWSKIGDPKMMETRLRRAFGAQPAKTFKYVSEDQIRAYTQALRAATTDQRMKSPLFRSDTSSVAILPKTTKTLLANLRELTGILPPVE